MTNHEVYRPPRAELALPFLGGFETTVPQVKAWFERAQRDAERLLFDVGLRPIGVPQIEGWDDRPHGLIVRLSWEVESAR